MTMPVRAALYLRVSTGRQADSDFSIPDQRRQAKTYCASRGMGDRRRLGRARFVRHR
jgi:site-specific DNA recombinase